MNTKAITIICSVALVITLLLTAVSHAVFGNIEYFQREFEKYEVTENIDMDMDNIMYMMAELMEYLNGDRDDLDGIITNVGGIERDFFSEREKIHMADCKKLFDAGFFIKNCCAVISLICFGALIFKKEKFGKTLIKYMGFISAAILAITVVIAIAAITNFDKCFVMFHKLFFRNDLWLLDPAEDLVINILVEPFFADMAAKIAIYCGIILLIFIIAAVFAKRRRV